MVYVLLYDPRRDFSQAKRWGELCTVFNKGLFPDDVEPRLAAMQQIAAGKLKGFNEHHDWVVLSGDPVGIAVVVASLVERGVEYIPLLKWDREAKGYYEVKVPCSKRGTKTWNNQEAAGNS